MNINKSSKHRYYQMNYQDIMWGIPILAVNKTHLCSSQLRT